MPLKRKKCAQCGQIRCEEEFKVKYTKKDGTQSRNRYCRDCEDDTRNYLALIAAKNEGPLSTAQEQQLIKYTSVFQVLERQGLSTPLSRSAVKTKAAKPTVDARLAMIKAMYGDETATIGSLREVSKEPEVAKESSTPAEVPEALQQWLDATFETWKSTNIVPEYLNEVVYPTLKAEFRPETGWDAVKLAPTYDDTYKEVLNEISNKFWDYEDWFIEQKGNENESTNN